VLELDDLEDGPLDLDVVPVLELVGGDRENHPLCRTFVVLAIAQPQRVAKTVTPAREDNKAGASPLVKRERERPAHNVVRR
jgi:hypothetical protein